MARCRIDSSIQRVEMEGFAFPLGVYPIEAIQPKAGYTITFEPADGVSGESREDIDDDDSEFGGLAEGGPERSEGDAPGELEEWPDRYVFDILVPSTRLEALCRSLFALLPGRVYPILDVLGQDEFREVDPYVSYDLIGIERFLDALRRFGGFFYEDGLVGFGAMSDEPFIYVLVDEHKIVTVRAETALREKVEAVLSAFDLEEVSELLGPDSATHEHRGVLDAPDDRRDLLNAEEIVEELRDEWRLVLNIDPESNVDEQGQALGTTGWRCLVRHDWEIPPKEVEKAKAATAAAERPKAGRYAEIYLTADCLRQAEEMALEHFRSMLPAELREEWSRDEEGPDTPLLVAADRLNREHFLEDLKHLGAPAADMDSCRVWHAAWQPLSP